MGVARGKLGFRGNLGIRVIRANPSRRQRLADLISRLLGRYSA
jgi:hypothetical protein